MAAVARARLGSRVPGETARSRICAACGCRRIHALVRSGRPATAYQGAGNICAPVLPGRQAAISQRPAARARLCAGYCIKLCGNRAVRRLHRRAHRPAVQKRAAARAGMSMASERPRAAMILAAGRGERMRPLTDTTPKPLLRVHGQPLIERHVKRLVHAGMERIVINLAWLGGQIRDYLGDGARFGAAIIYSDETARALETGGGIFRALPHLSPGPFTVVNGDIYTDFPLDILRLAADRDVHLVLVPTPSYLK